MPKFEMFCETKGKRDQEGLSIPLPLDEAAYLEPCVDLALSKGMLKNPKTGKSFDPSDMEGLEELRKEIRAKFRRLQQEEDKRRGIRVS